MNNVIDYLFQDWEANRDVSIRPRFVVLMFRLAQASSRLPFYLAWLGKLYRGIYQILIVWVMGVELPWKTQVGRDLKIRHGVALVVNSETTIGEDVMLRHATTIGNKQLSDGSYSGSPKIGNHVDIGSNVVILGNINIGDRAVIGAGSVVVKDVPTGAVVVGNPAKIIRIIEPDVSANLVLANRSKPIV